MKRPRQPGFLRGMGCGGWIPDSLHYLLRRFRASENPVISHGSCALFSRPEGFKLFDRERELTQKTGLGISWTTQKGFEDDSSFTAEVLAWRPNRLAVLRRHPRQPEFRLIFDFSWKKAALLRCTIRMETAYPLIDPKITLMLNPGYKTWIAGIHQGSFPAFRGWMDVGTPDSRPGSVGVRHSHDDDGGLLPSLVLSFENGVHAIENSDKKTRSRVLCACFPGRYENPELTGWIRIMKNACDLERWISAERRRSLDGIIPRP